jgi:hypothetical protein
MSRLVFASLILVLLLSPVLPASSLAQTMDTPTVSAIRVSEHSIVLRLTAGPLGAPQGITVEWLEGLWYDFGGGWTNTTYLVWCDFEGTPTLNVSGGVAYQLGPNESVDVEVGDLFDETGVNTNFTGELDPGSDYIFRAKTRGDETLPDSPWTVDLLITTEAENPEDCTFTQGFWKTHENAWPVNSLTLGTVVYTKAELLDIFNTPAEGNGLIFLAHQLIAAKLNVAGDAMPTPAVTQAIADADAIIGGLVVPPVGADYLDPAAASPLTETLDQFNNGTLPGNCGVTPVETTTWGLIKASFDN